MPDPALSGFSMRLQDELNRINLTVGLSVNECLNSLAGTTNLDSTAAVGQSGLNWSKQDAAHQIVTPS